MAYAVIRGGEESRMPELSDQYQRMMLEQGRRADERARSIGQAWSPAFAALGSLGADAIRTAAIPDYLQGTEYEDSAGGYLMLPESERRQVRGEARADRNFRNRNAYQTAYRAAYDAGYDSPEQFNQAVAESGMSRPEFQATRRAGANAILDQQETETLLQRQAALGEQNLLMYARRQVIEDATQPISKALSPQVMQWLNTPIENGGAPQPIRDEYFSIVKEDAALRSDGSAWVSPENILARRSANAAKLADIANQMPREPTPEQKDAMHFYTGPDGVKRYAANGKPDEVSLQLAKDKAKNAEVEQRLVSQRELDAILRMPDSPQKAQNYATWLAREQAKAKASFEASYQLAPDGTAWIRTPDNEWTQARPTKDNDGVPVKDIMSLMKPEGESAVGRSPADAVATYREIQQAIASGGMPSDEELHEAIRRRDFYANPNNRSMGMVGRNDWMPAQKKEAEEAQKIIDRAQRLGAKIPAPGQSAQQVAAPQPIRTVSQLSDDITRMTNQIAQSGGVPTPEQYAQLRELTEALKSAQKRR